MLIGLAGAVGAGLIATQPVAWADDTGVPNINTYPPISPVDFTVMEGSQYAFSAPGGLTCVINKTQNGYGCSGPIPAAPDGATFVSAVGGQEPEFANTAAPVFGGPTKPLPPQTRLSYRNISCAIDGTGATVCVNTATQHGFVLSPAGSFAA
jgi:hypothetical protein